MREEIWNRNIESLDERYAKLKEQLLLHQNEEQNSKNGITYGISEVEDKRVLYAIKDEKTYQLDTLYDSDTMMNLWVQGQKTSCVLTIECAGELVGCKNLEEFHCLGDRKSTRLNSSH